MATKPMETKENAAGPVARPAAEKKALSAYGTARSTVQGSPLNADAGHKTHTYCRASNYLSLGIVYLQDNPLLREPLKPEHIKNRLLRHCRASPGLSFAYIQWHGAPGFLGAAYVEGPYSEIYTDKSEAASGLKEFFRRSSFPGGIGSQHTPETQGSMHEGGEFRNEEAVTGPLADSPAGVPSHQPRRDARARAISDDIDRFVLAIHAIDQIPKPEKVGAHAKERYRDLQIECRNYAYEHGIDNPEVVGWRWPFQRPPAIHSPERFGPSNRKV